MEILLKLLLVTCIFIFIFIGFVLNVYVVVEVLKHKRRSANNVFPFFMAISDIGCLISDVFVMLDLFMSVLFPAFVAVLGTYTYYVFIKLQFFSFFSYMLLRFLIVVWPFHCRMYLKKWHVYLVALMNLIFCTLPQYEFLYTYSDLLFSTKMIGYFQLHKHAAPIFYKIIAVIIFFATLVLVIWTICLLMQKGPTENKTVLKMKRKAIKTVLLCFFIFALSQFLNIAVSITTMVLKMYGKEVPMTIPAAVYLTRLVAYIANPLLYFKAKNGTRNVSKQASQISNATQKTINNDNTT